MSNKYVKSNPLSLKDHPEFNEKWVRNLIENDPSILGLGDLVLKDVERMQLRGRLDLLLQDIDTKRRYEVELQLGPTDASHIIRTIEYWDIEKKRYPQYEHCAVLIAENITSRFLNVVSLFNGTIPLIAIQMQALKVGDYLTLVFTKIMDEFSLGLIDDGEGTEPPTDRAYWEKRATKAMVNLVDQMLEILRSFDPTLNLKYNKFYIGLERDGQPYNFVKFVPKKQTLNFHLKLSQTEGLDDKIEGAGFDTLEYDKKWELYRLRLTVKDIETKPELLKELSKRAYDRRASV